MPFPVTINGKIYQASDFTPYGYVTSFPNIVQDIADVGAAASAVTAGVNYGNSFRNRLRNAGFTINQRSVSGTVTLAAGAYGHDGFKAGASGCTYTFARSGGVTTLTITAGSLVQAIEGPLYLPEGGTYTLSWVGSAQGRFGGSGYVASPLTVTGLTPDASVTVEWNAGTLALPMFEPGTKRTVFEYRDDEYIRNQRYFQTSYPAGSAPGSANAFNSVYFIYTGGTNAYAPLYVGTLPVVMRANPTATVYNPRTGATGTFDANNGTAVPGMMLVSTDRTLVITSSASDVAGATTVRVHFTLSAEL